MIFPRLPLLTRLRIPSDRLLLGGLLSLAVILRVAFLPSIPTGLNIDELGLAYDDRSLLETGKDRLGNPWPLHLSGFWWGDNALLALYKFPFLELLGTANPLAFRLPIVITNIAFLALAFLLARELFGKHIAFLALVLLAVSPWHMTLSRLAWNTSLAPVWYLAGATLLVIGLRRKQKLLVVLASLPFALAFYTYATALLWIPLLIGVILIAFRRHLRPMVRSLTGVGICLAVLSAPMMLYVLANQFHIRLIEEGMLPFSLPVVTLSRFDAISTFTLPFPLSILSIPALYALHLSPTFLFFNSTFEPIFPPGGLLLLAELPLVAVGILWSFWNRHREEYLFLLLILLLAPLPASLTIESVPHPLRFTSALPYLAYASAVGGIVIWRWFGRIASRRVSRTLRGGLLCIGVANAIVSLWIFFARYPLESARFFHAPAPAIVQELGRREGNFDTLIVSEHDMTDFSYVDLLFYGNIPPLEFQERRQDREEGYGLVRVFDYFVRCQARQCSLEEVYQLRRGSHTLFLVRPEELPSATVLKRFALPDGKPYANLVK